jgi:hypothetical protein
VKRLRVTTAAVVCVVLAGLCTTAALAAPSPWAAKANATCRVWQQKFVATFGANPKEPSTASALYAFEVKARPLEVGELHALQAIRLARPPAATKALSYLAANVKVLDAALAAYRAGDRTRFLERSFAWQTDKRPSAAFKALGAPACT